MAQFWRKREGVGEEKKKAKRNNEGSKVERRNLEQLERTEKTNSRGKTPQRILMSARKKATNGRNVL